jgi:hypothetical protein
MYNLVTRVATRHVAEYRVDIDVRCQYELISNYFHMVYCVAAWCFV